MIKSVKSKKPRSESPWTELRREHVRKSAMMKIIVERQTTKQ